jgi:hypothetical protein
VIEEILTHKHATSQTIVDMFVTSASTMFQDNDNLNMNCNGREPRDEPVASETRGQEDMAYSLPEDVRTVVRIDFVRHFRMHF